MIRIAACAFFGFFFLTGCFGTQGLKPVKDIAPVDCNPLQCPESGGMVFRDAESWQAFWNRYCMVVDGQGDKLAAPQIDFSSRMLIGVFSGEKPTGGYTVAIQRVLEDTKKLVVEYQEKSPPKDAMVIMVVTYPCQIISVLRSDKAVEFKNMERD